MGRHLNSAIRALQKRRLLIRLALADILLSLGEKVETAPSPYEAEVYEEVKALIYRPFVDECKRCACDPILVIHAVAKLRGLKANDPKKFALLQTKTIRRGPKKRPLEASERLRKQKTLPSPR